MYFTGPFENSGPVPPKAEQETTYSIVWTVTNNLNNVSGAKVIAKLPSYMAWNNVTSPSSENISYDSVTGEVVWNLGAVSAETGFSKSKREVAFQVTLKPSLTQIGSSPNIIEEQILSGKDDYSDIQVTDRRNDLNIRLVDDPGFTEGDDVVLK